MRAGCFWKNLVQGTGAPQNLPVCLWHGCRLCSSSVMSKCIQLLRKSLHIPPLGPRRKDRGKARGRGLEMSHHRPQAVGRGAPHWSPPHSGADRQLQDFPLRELLVLCSFLKFCSPHIFQTARRDRMAMKPRRQASHRKPTALHHPSTQALPQTTTVPNETEEETFPPHP